MAGDRTRRALVTGASAGIGRATAIALAEACVEVLAVGRRESELHETARAGQGRIQPLAADVTIALDRGSIREILGSEPLDFLVHGAGVFPRGRLATLRLDDWRAAMATNVDARLHLVMDLRPILRGGRVLFIGSDAATHPRLGGAAYSVSKAASKMLWRCLALELGEEIAFGIAKPGLVATAMLDLSIAAPRDEFPAGAVYQEMLERGETVAPETVAQFFRWLLLDAARADFAREEWNIRDPSHHGDWLEGSVYTPLPF
ncbi:MAG: SDR family oxidoreductase [Deltaproteobacteria bacterium]